MAIVLPVVLVISKLFSFFSLISSATDTITQSQPLPDGSTLVSRGGTFELGFFNPGNSANRYVGIWYQKIPVRRVVWVANRDSPIRDNSSKLIISQDGNLVLLSQNQTLLWSTNTTTKALSPIVQLLDNGNLVLKDGNKDNNNNEQSFLWQSFDHPCDTLLPEMKFRWDRKNGINMRACAWKNWDDPSPGDFTGGLAHDSNPEAVMWNGSVPCYRAGPWNGIRFSGTFALKDNPLYNYKFVNNEDEVYYMYTLKNISVISIDVINQTLHRYQRLTWVPQTRTWIVYQSLPQDICDGYNRCGPYGNCAPDASPVCQCLDGFKPKSSQNWNAMDWTQGCVRSDTWSCGVKDKDGFRRFAGMKLPDTTHSWVDRSMTLEDCKSKCLENCNCTAYANLDIRGAGSGCAIWFGDLIDLRLSQNGQDLYVRMAASDAEQIHTKRVVLVVTITGLLVLIVLLALSYIYRRKTKYREKAKKTMPEEKKDASGQEDLELPFFDLSTILNATNNLSVDNKLGEGGFGPVYKGTLPHGEEIAVKRLSKNSGQGLKEFKNEVMFCAKLQHRNLVKVLGYCIEGEEKMLLYEYMPNKSLDSFFLVNSVDPSQSKLLDWSKRFHIICGIARGLLYLHHDSRLRIIHRDLKASNILLDNDMNPKISDFGMARMFGGDQIEGSTSRIVGTYGYMAPEYAIDGLFSVKSDVFSFGILLLEIISGKKNRRLTYPTNSLNLIGHAWRLWKKGTPEEFIDTSLKDSCILSEVVHCIQIGLLCLQHHPDDRPNMTFVVVMLSNENTLPQPKEPGFLLEQVSHEREQSFSVNEVTISSLGPR